MNFCLRLLIFSFIVISGTGCNSFFSLSSINRTEVPSTRQAATEIPPTPTAAVSRTADPQQAQLELLASSSLNYLAADEDAAYEVAHSLGYSPDYGRPQDMCGPLAFKILQDAGIVSKYASLRDYWLLDPAEDSYLLERTFPRDDFMWFSTTQPIDQLDYGQFPLKAGDLLYIYSGARGDYSHVLTVTRVDDAGRAYSVTNNFTENGFVIQEFMLYDPTRRGKGIFYDWSDLANARLGLTGFGGFDLWRPKSLPYYADPGEEDLITEIDTRLGNLGGDWYMRIGTIDGEVLYSRKAGYRLNEPASMRLLAAVLFMKALEVNGISSLQIYIENNTWAGRSYEALLHSMLVDADNDALVKLRESIQQSGLDVAAAVRAWGLENTYFSLDTASVEDIIILLGELYRGELLGEESTRIILDMMAVPSQEDILRAQVPEGYSTYGLSEMLDGDFPKIGQQAVLKGMTNTYLLVIYGYRQEGTPINLPLLQQAVDAIMQAFRDYLEIRGL